MAKSRAKAMKIRRQLKPLIDFDFWVREFDSGLIWCGAKYENKTRMGYLVDALEHLGYSVETNGKPGTAGAYIVEIPV